MKNDNETGTVIRLVVMSGCSLFWLPSLWTRTILLAILEQVFIAKCWNDKILMIFSKVLFDKMKNTIELVFKFMEPILLEGLHRYFPPNHELFVDVKKKNWDIGKKQKKLKTETIMPFSMEL